MNRREAVFVPDWHRAQIKAALEMRGLNFRKVSLEAGLAADTVKNALYRPWPKGEKLIADAIGVTPEEIWPSRYPGQNEVA
jgi:Ner family transcriptional regulator